ncbi:MAG TPA: hypothetical protein VNP96_07975 [Solirubrobacterales bacterium]|nr:hypothetical protein [Solirubrobacterales bacterium]
MGIHRITHVAGLSLACGFLFCGWAAAAAPSLSEVREFDGYRVYYAGDEVAGVPLEEVEKAEWPENRRFTGWNFYYGDCALPAGEGGCSPPLQIQNYNTCRRWADAYPGKPRLFNFRGAKAAWVSSADSLEIYTGHTTVVIFANRKSVAKRAASLIRGIRHAQSSLLPPPTPDSLWGKLPCQIKPG